LRYVAPCRPADDSGRFKPIVRLGANPGRDGDRQAADRRGRGASWIMIAILNRLLGSSLFFGEVGPRSAWRIIGWWEVRRVAFNLIVGITGLVKGIPALGSAPS